MSYTPHEWQNNEFITAEKLNNIEEGIAEGGSGVLICNTSYEGNDFVLDKTAQQIYDALLAGTPAYIKIQYGSLSDYEGHLFLAPIIRFTNYNYTNLIKIYASKSSQNKFVGNIDGTAAMFRFTASGLNAYPAYSGSLYTNQNSSISGSMID